MIGLLFAALMMGKLTVDGSTVTGQVGDRYWRVFWPAARSRIVCTGDVPFELRFLRVDHYMFDGQEFDGVQTPGIQQVSWIGDGMKQTWDSDLTGYYVRPFVQHVIAHRMMVIRAERPNQTLHFTCTETRTRGCRNGEACS